MIRPLVLTALAVSLGVMSSCNQSESSSGTRSGANSSRPAWMLTSQPEDTVSVAEAKVSAEEGDTIVIRGRIGGRKQAISSGSSIFTIVDLKVPYCGQADPDDHCSEPWDYCCEPPEVMLAHSASVQLVDETAAGRMIDPVAGGLDHLQDVIVVGTVGARPNRDVLTIRATGVYRVEE